LLDNGGNNGSGSDWGGDGIEVPFVGKRFTGRQWVHILNPSTKQTERKDKMLYQVAVKQNDLVVFTDTVDACTPNDAANKTVGWSQLAYNFVEVYDAYDEYFDVKPIFSKVIVG